MAAENHKTSPDMTAPDAQQGADLNRFKKVQINFMAPFATNVIIDPAKLAIDGSLKTQKTLAEELQKEIPILPFKEQFFENDRANKNPLFTPSHHPDETIYPIVFLQATLEDEELRELEKRYSNFSCSFSPTEAQDIPYSIEIKKVRVSIYHYGLGNITISTVLTSYDDSFVIDSNNNLDPKDHKQLHLNYKKLFEFVENCGHEDIYSDNSGNKCYPIVQQFKAVVKELHEKINLVMSQQESLSAVRKEYYTLPQASSNKNILNYDGFLWVHRLYYLPLPPQATEEQKYWYKEAANKTFCRLTNGTTVEGLTYEHCNIAYITPGSSFALVENLDPIGSEASSVGDIQSRENIDDDQVTSSFCRVLQTAGILSAATMELTNSLDIITDAYEAVDGDNNQKITDSHITESLQRISHTRSLINQYEISQHPMPSKFLSAIKKEWTLKEQWDYIDWKFEALRDLHDRKSLQRLNIATLSFSIIATIGILLNLLDLSQGWPDISSPSFSLIASLVSIFLAPAVVYIAATGFKKLKPHLLGNVESKITNLNYKHIILLSFMIFGIVIIIFLVLLLSFSFVT